MECFFNAVDLMAELEKWKSYKEMHDAMETITVMCHVDRMK